MINYTFIKFALPIKMLNYTTINFASSNEMIKCTFFRLLKSFTPGVIQLEPTPDGRKKAAVTDAR